MSAGVTRYVVRKDKSGNPRVVPAGRIILRSDEKLETLEERVVRDLYAMECEQGSRFNGVGEYGTKVLKKVWVDNVARDAAFDRRRDEALRVQRERLGYDHS